MRKFLTLLFLLLLPSLALAQANPWASIPEPNNSGTAVTLQNSDCGHFIPFTASSTVAVTAPAAISVGCPVKLGQMGAGTVYVTPGVGATIASPNNSTIAQGDFITLDAIANAGGSAAIWLIGGQAAAFSSPGGGPIPPTLPPTPPTPLTTYYVSTSGSDSNAGTSSGSPWATISKVNGATFSDNTAILFDGGQSWTGCLAFIKGGNVTSTTPTGGIQLGSYGSGRPTFTSNCPGSPSGTQGPKSAVVKFDGVNGAVISNIIVKCANDGTQFGILVQDSIDTNGITNVTIKGSDASGCNIGSSATQDFSADIEVLGVTTTASCSPVNKVLIDTNTAEGTSVSATDDMGINVMGCQGASTLVPGSLLNVTNVTTTNNTVKWIGGRASTFASGGAITAGPYGGASGNGIVHNGAQFVNVAYNTVSAGGYNTNTCGGPGGIWFYNVDNGAIQFNEVDSMAPSTAPVSPTPTNGGTACDWLAYDLDGGTTNSAIQYNHSYNNFGPGLEFYISNSSPARSVWGPNVIRFNISEGDAAAANTSNTAMSNLYVLGGIFVSGGGASPSVEAIYGNTVAYTSATMGPSCLSFSTIPTSGLFANNICDINGTGGPQVFLDGGGQSPTGLSFLGNIYHNQNGSCSPCFSAASFPGNINGVSTWGATVAGGEAGSSQAVPGYTSTPAMAACTVTANVGPQSCPTWAVLASGSAAKGAGANLTASPYNQTIGIRDYYGNTMPNSSTSGENIGASGVYP